MCVKTINIKVSKKVMLQLASILTIFSLICFENFELNLSCLLFLIHRIIERNNSYHCFLETKLQQEPSNEDKILKNIVELIYLVSSFESSYFQKIIPLSYESILNT